MKQEELIKACSDLLYKLCDLVESRNTLNYYDINISSEYFFIPLLNQVFDCDLKNLNTEEHNAAAIDLYDTDGKIAVQVTSNSSADKIHTTLKKYRENKLYEKYQRLIVVVIVRSHTYKADFANDTDEKFTFSKNSDIYTISSLIKAISALSVEKTANIKEYLEYQLDTLFDESKVSTIERSFNYISKNTNDFLNESYFEIDNERFLQDFQEKLNKESIIRLYSLSKEEGRYCILNLLHKICTNRSTYIIKSEENWIKAEKYLSNCILIPDFQADEIPAISNNTTIFINNEGDIPNTLRIPQRSMRFLSDKLKKNGYDDSYKLLHKTQGLYYYIKKTLFTGQLRNSGWEKDNDKAVIVAALLGKWTESDGDKAIIEKLYGDSYDKFLSYLTQYLNVEDAYLIRKHDTSYNMIYEIADPLLAIYSHKSVIDLPIAKEFFDITKKVISERDPIFDEPFDKHFYLSALKKPKYSHSIKNGIARTLILIALYCDRQNAIPYLIRNLLTDINTVNDWAYISQYIQEFCEAAPDIVVDCLEDSIDNHNGLIDLFTIEKANILFGPHYYTNILWCLEQLLPCKDYAARVVRILFKLGEKIDKCSTGNNPRDEISRIFCTWYNVSALTIEEKIEFAKMGVEKYPFFWDILYNEIGKKDTIFCGSVFTYRDTDDIIPYTSKDQLHFYGSYAKILISNINGCLEKLIKLLDLLPKCTDEIFNSIQNETTIAITKLSDLDKEQIKTTLRKIIYHHRLFANSKWAASAERISKIEKLCKEITFEDQAYDFLYLTGSRDIPIFNPVVYDPDGNYRHENKEAIEQIIESEMIRFKDAGIELKHYLELVKSRPTQNIGEIIAKYYCNSKYDESILYDIISCTDNPGIAVDYVYNCSDQSLTELYSAIEALSKDHYADKFYIAFLLSLPFGEKSSSFVLALPQEAAKNYWSNVSWVPFMNSDSLNDAIKKLIEFSNWRELYFIIQEQESKFNTKDIVSIIAESTNKMILEGHKIDDQEGYMLKQLLAIVYKRIGNDFENFPVLFEIEVHLSHIIGWNNMKCCQYLFKRNATLYANILLLIYKKDDGSFDETLDQDKKSSLYKFEQDVKFCPGEDNGSINKDILNKWVSEFKSQLEYQKQNHLFYVKLGKLFSCAPEGSDGIFPHEVIRDKIEEIGNKELIRSFASAIIYGRGVYCVTGGEEEFKLGKKYAQIRQKLSIRYPKTAKIFDIISSNYFDESKRDREIAETEIY